MPWKMTAHDLFSGYMFISTACLANGPATGLDDIVQATRDFVMIAGYDSIWGQSHHHRTHIETWWCPQEQDIYRDDDVQTHWCPKVHWLWLTSTTNAMFKTSLLVILKIVDDCVSVIRDVLLRFIPVHVLQVTMHWCTQCIVLYRAHRNWRHDHSGHGLVWRHPNESPLFATSHHQRRKIDLVYQGRHPQLHKYIACMVARCDINLILNNTQYTVYTAVRYSLCTYGWYPAIKKYYSH